MKGFPAPQKRASASSKVRAFPSPVTKSRPARSVSRSTSCRFRLAKKPMMAPTSVNVTSLIPIDAVSACAEGTRGVSSIAAT
jgi:hypothetical protein